MARRLRSSLWCQAGSWLIFNVRQRRNFPPVFDKIIVIAALGFWTFLVVAAYGYGHSMSGWSDGAGGRSSNGWIPFVVIWAVPVALYFPIRAFSTSRNVFAPLFTRRTPTTLRNQTLPSSRPATTPPGAAEAGFFTRLEAQPPIADEAFFGALSCRTNPFENSALKIIRRKAQRYR